MKELQCRVVAVAVTIVVFAFVAAAESPAAVGIFNWYASTSGGGAEIHYYLNLPGDSGSITICPDQSNSPGPPLRTIGLGSSDLTPGPHVVMWDGKDDGGTMTATGSYFARIYVHAAPVPTPADPNDPSQMPDNLRRVRDATGCLYGVAVDAGEENNDQTDPSYHTYGLVYLANMLYSSIEVLYPDGAPKTTWPNLIGSPVGLALSDDGRVFTMGKTATNYVLLDFLSDGTGMLGGTACGSTTAYGGGAAWGTVADGTARFQTQHFGRIREWSVLSEPVVQDGRWTNFDINRTIEIPISPPLCYQTAKDTVGGYLYVAQPNHGSVRSLRRYAWDGVSYSEDLTWEPESGENVVAVCISRSDPNILIIGRDQPVGSNLERWYIEHPSPEIDGPAFLDGYHAATLRVHNVASDSRGNVFFDADGASNSAKQSWLGMFVFPDNGSEDTRIAGPFVHEGSGQAQEKPYIRNVTLLPPGSVVTVRGKAVSACFGSVVYVQEPDRASGIRTELSSPSSLSPGTLVNVTGTVDRSLGENRLINAQLEEAGSAEVPRPLGMRTADVDNDPSEQLLFTGLNNVGLLVRVTGVVINVDTQNGLFYVDDGCGLDNGFGCMGLSVSFGDTTPPLAGDRVAVTGVSSCRATVLVTDRIINGIPVPAGTTVYEPTILPRDQSDLSFL